MPQIGPGQQNVSVDANTGKSFGALPDLSVNDDTSLQQIQDNYKQIGSSFNNMAAAAAANVGARQKSLVGNDFGATSPYMYDTYYEPGASSFASSMRMEGTQQALETGMDRGKKAAEQAVKDAQNNYSNAVDAYNNLANQYQQQVQNTYKNPTIAEFSGELLGNDTQMQELMAYAQAQGLSLDEVLAQTMNGANTYKMVTNWDEQDRRTNDATNPTLSHFGVSRSDYDSWDQSRKDEFWGRADVGNYWTKLYADSFIKDHYSSDTFAKYQNDCNQITSAIESTYNYINGITDNLVDIEKMNMSGGYIDLELLAPVVEHVSSTDNELFEKIWRDELTDEEGNHISRNDLFKKYITNKDEQELVQKVYQEYTNQGAYGLFDVNGENNAPGEAIQRATDIISLRVFGKETERKDDAKLGADVISINVDSFVKEHLGIDMKSIRFLRNMQNTNEEQFNTLIHQASAVYAGANAIDIADGQKWYKVNGEYKQLEAGTAVMYSLPGASEDKDLKKYLELMADRNDASLSEGDKSKLDEEAQKSFDAYRDHMIAALQWENQIESVTTADAYAAILYHSNPNEYKDLMVNGKKISDIIADWKTFAKSDPEAAYKKMGDIVRYTYQNIGSYWAATPEFMSETNIEQLNLENSRGESTLPTSGKSDDWMPDEDASVLFMILSTSMNQFNSGNTDGNVDPATFITADGSGMLMDFVTGVGKEVEVFFNMASSAISSLFKAGTNIFTGDWEHTFDAGALSFQQVVDTLTGQWGNIGEDETSFSKLFGGELNPNSWSYKHDFARDQRENLADVMNPILIGEANKPVGIGIEQTSRGVGFWENTTAMKNAVVSIASMAAGNVVENFVEDAAVAAVKGAASSISSGAMKGLSAQALKTFNNGLDDVAANVALRSLDNLNIDDIVNGNLIHLTGDSAQFSFEYTDDFIRGMSNLANAADDTFDDFTDNFSKVLRESADDANGAFGNATKTTMELAGITPDDIAKTTAPAIAREAYQNMQIMAFTGKTADEISALPQALKQFISNAISANVSRDAVEATIINGAGDISVTQMLLGNGGEAALDFVVNMSRDGMKSTINQLIDQAQVFANAGKIWGTDDTIRFLARNGWDSGRTAILAKEWLVNQAQMHAENALFNWTIPEVYHGEAHRETAGEYFSNPMNYIIPGAASFGLMGLRKLVNRANLAVTSKALEKAMNEWEATGGGMGEEALASLKKIQKLETKLTQLSNKALDAGRSYDEIQKYTEQANDAALAAQTEIEKSALWEIAKNNGQTKYNTSKEFFEALNEGKIDAGDLAFSGSRVANAKAANAYYGNATALGRYTGGLASVEDTKTNLGILKTMQDYKKSHRFTEIKKMDMDFWEKQKLLYKEMTAEAVKKYGKTIIGLESNLNEFFDRLLAAGKDAVEHGDLTTEKVRLGYLPIQSLLNNNTEGPTALRNLFVAQSVLDPSSANPYLSRGIDYDSILEAAMEGKTESTLRDMKGNVIMDGNKEKMFDINTKGANFLDQLTCYQNALIGHQFNDPLFGRSDNHIGEALLKNKNVIIKGKKAKAKAKSKDVKEIHGELDKLGKKADDAVKADLGNDMTFQKLVDQKSKSSKTAADNAVAADEARTKKIAELSAKKADLEKRLETGGVETRATKSEPQYAPKPDDESWKNGQGFSILNSKRVSEANDKAQKELYKQLVEKYGENPTSEEGQKAWLSYESGGINDNGDSLEAGADKFYTPPTKEEVVKELQAQISANKKIVSTSLKQNGKLDGYAEGSADKIIEFEDELKAITNIGEVKPAGLQSGIENDVRGFDKTMPARILGSDNVAGSLAKWDNAQSEFLELVELYKSGDGIKIGQEVTLFDASGKNHSFPMTDSLYNAIKTYADNVGEIPRDATVYLMMGKEYTPGWAEGRNGKRIYAKKQYTSNKKLDKEFAAWGKEQTAWKDKRGRNISRSMLNKISFVSPDGSLNTGALEKVYKVIESDIRSKLPKGVNGDRIVASMKNYVTTMARDMDPASLTFDSVLEMYDRIAPDVELTSLAIDTGLFRQLNSLENIGYSLPDLADHLDILIAKAEVTNSDDLKSLLSAKLLVDRMLDNSTAPKATSGFEVRENYDYDDDEDIDNLGYSDRDGADESTQLSNIFGQSIDDEWEVRYNVGAIDTSWSIDGSQSRPTLEAKQSVSLKNRTGAIPSDYVEWSDAPLFTRQEAEEGIKSLSEVLKAMRDVRSPYYDAYSNQSLDKMSKTYEKSYKESNKLFKGFNSAVKEAYDSGKYPGIIELVNSEREARKARQSAISTNIQETAEYDYLAALGVARPGSGYARTKNIAQTAKAEMELRGAGDVNQNAFSKEYTQIRLQASTLKGQLEQLKTAYEQFSKITGKKMLPETRDAIDALIAEQPRTQNVRYDSADTYENSLAFALGTVEDVEKMIVPNEGEYVTPSQRTGKSSFFTPEQLKSAAWGETKSRKVMSNKKVTVTLKDGKKLNYLVEAGYDNSGNFDIAVFNEKTMRPLDFTSEGKMPEKTRLKLIDVLNGILAEREDLAANKVKINEDGSISYTEIDDKDKAVIMANAFEDSFDEEANATFGDSNDLDFRYAQYLNSRESLDQLQEEKLAKMVDENKKSIQKELDDVNKELEQAKKDVYKEVKQTPADKIQEDLTKKYLSKEDYAEYKELISKRDAIAKDSDIYDSRSGATFVDDTNGLKNYVTLTSLKQLMGWEPGKEQLTMKDIENDKSLSKADKKSRKEMLKEMNKQIRKGKTFYRSTEDFGLPKNIDHRSKGASLDMYLKLEKQISEYLGGIDSDSIYISKDMGQLLAKISEESLTPTKFSKVMSDITAFNKWVQDQQLAGGASYINAFTITQVRDAIMRDPKFAIEYVKTCADMKNSASIRDFAQRNQAKLTEIALATGDMTMLNDLLGAVSKRPGIDDGGIIQSITTKVLNEKAENWKGSKSIVGNLNEYISSVFSDPTFAGAIPVLRAKMLILNYDNAMRVLKESFDGDPKVLAEQAAKMAYARTELFFNPGRSLAKGGFEGFMNANDIRLYNDQMNRLTGIKKTTTFMDAATDVFFAMRYKLMLTGRAWSGVLGIGQDIKSLGRQSGMEMTAENFNKVGTQFMLHGNANGIYSMAALACVAAVTAMALGIPTAWDDLSPIDPVDGEFRIPTIAQKFQTIGQIWLPNAYNPETGFYVDTSKSIYGLDTMSSTFTLQNSLFKTVDRATNPNAYAKTPQRGLPFIGVNNPINQIINSPISKAVGDELLSSNLLSPYRAMYEVLMDTTYFGNNIWEKKYLPDGSENRNYDPMRNIKASFMHIAGLDELLDGGKGYNDYVKGKLDKNGDYVNQDRIGTVSGSGILQHEYLTGFFNFLDGDYLEGTIEAGELPLKSKNLSSQARTEYNNTVKNTIAQYMSEYQFRTKDATNDEKDAIYAEVVQKCADVVSNWSAKWGYVFGDDQSLVPFATRTLMAMTAGEYDDNLDYLQNAIWKAENIANIEHGSWSWLSDEDLDRWIAEGHTVEEFNAEKQRRTDAYNKALDDEYIARQALRNAGYSEDLLEQYNADDIKAASRAVNQKVFTGILKKLDSPIGEFKNFKEMKSYYEAQINATTSTKQKASIAEAYNKYVTDVIAPYASEYGEAIINDGYYQGKGLANMLADYIILPANKYYRGKSPRASYLKDLFGVGYKDSHNLPSDEEVIEMFANARRQIQKGASASAASILDRTIDQIKKGRLYASDLDYSKIVRLKALLGAKE